jgi:hypothetical protein
MRKRVLIQILLAILLLASNSHACAEAAVNTPGTPIGLKALVSGKSVILTWKAPAEGADLVEGYEIVRAALASGPFEKMGQVGLHVLTFTDTSARKEIIYFYKVRAVGKEAGSPYSQPVAVEITGP